MPRTTSALFIPLFESFLLSLICFSAFHAFFSSTVPADYSPSTRSTLFCSLFINVATCLLQLIVSAAGKTEFIIQGTVSYKHSLAIANANCCASALLLIVHLSAFLQAMTIGNSEDQLQKKNWVGAAIGTSSNPMIMGSIYSGIVLAYLTIMLLISIYMSYVATPDSVASYLFMEPRFLVIATAFLGFGLSQLVASSCATNPIGSITGFSLFAATACWFDLLTMKLLKNSPWYRSIAKFVGLQTLAIIPLFFLTSSQVPTTIKIICAVMASFATVSNIVDIIFREWNPVAYDNAFSKSSQGGGGGAAAASVQPRQTIISSSENEWLLTTGHRHQQQQQPPTFSPPTMQASTTTIKPLDFFQTEKRHIL